MPQLEHIEAIEKRLWNAADTLRANSNYASNEYFLPVMGLVFLRHAQSRYLAVKDDIEARLPMRNGKRRPLSKQDFARRSAIFLRPEAQFDYLVGLGDRDSRDKAIIAAMESIEKDYPSLEGALPKSEYQELDNEVLGQLLRSLNPEQLKKVSGDVFGRIYEYFLTRFADQKAHDGGEFFTPISLVSLIAHVLDPQRGTVLDPACGSGGMFVQSARTVEEHGKTPAEQLTFYGLEKNATTIHLARMNLIVHGLEGNIHRAITYYEDPHKLRGKADYVMANPPFNVDEIDADKIKSDPRLSFGLPGVNKQGKVSNGNYIWISYFHSYLNERGKAGFIMSSQASSAGGGELQLRRRLIESGDVDIMIAIRSNFFYSRTVPCELWFLNRNKPQAQRNKVLMIDARNIYRQVNRKIYDFSPEQQRNLLAIVWLYRGETKKFRTLINGYYTQMRQAATACFHPAQENGIPSTPLPDFLQALTTLCKAAEDSLSNSSTTTNPATEQTHQKFKTTHQKFQIARQKFEDDLKSFQKTLKKLQPTRSRGEQPPTLKQLLKQHTPLSETSHTLIKQCEQLHKLATHLTDLQPQKRPTNRPRKAADTARTTATTQLKQVHYFHSQAHWLTERFPQSKLRNIEGLVKLTDQKEISTNDWSLTPGRYVGVTPEEQDKNFNFPQTIKNIHIELEDLNAKAIKLAKTIKKNFEELGV